MWVYNVYILNHESKAVYFFHCIKSKAYKLKNLLWYLLYFKMYKIMLISEKCLLTYTTYIITNI